MKLSLRRLSTTLLGALAAFGCATAEKLPAIDPPPPLLEEPLTVIQPPRIEDPPLVVAPAIVVPHPTPETVRASEVESLVAEFARMRRAPPADLARELEAARQAFSTSRSDGARVKLAMALAVPGSPTTDETRALDVLDPLVKTPASQLHPLAVLIAAYIQEQRRLNAQVAGLQQNVQGLQQNVSGLQQKLDAITKLERNLTGRGETGTVRRK